MSKRIELMVHMVAHLMVSIGGMDWTRLKMLGPWILRIGGVIDTGTTLVLVLTDIIIIIVSILTGGVTRDIFWVSLRKRSHLHTMER